MMQCQGVVKEVSVGNRLIDILFSNVDGGMDSRNWSENFSLTARANAYRVLDVSKQKQEMKTRNRKRAEMELTSPLHSICFTMYSIPFLYCDLDRPGPVG